MRHTETDAVAQGLQLGRHGARAFEARRRATKAIEIGVGRIGAGHIVGELASPGPVVARLVEADDDFDSPPFTLVAVMVNDAGINLRRIVLREHQRAYCCCQHLSVSLAAIGVVQNLEPQIQLFSPILPIDWKQDLIRLSFVP